MFTLLKDLTIYWLCILMLSTMTSALEVTINQKQWVESKRGIGMMWRQMNLAFPDGKITYKALYRNEKSKAIIKKYGDHQFGLFFGNDWNWSAEKFMRVQVQVDGKTFDGTAKYLLKEAFVLEKQERAVVQMTWPLTSRNVGDHAVVRSDKIQLVPNLSLRIIQYPSHPHWLFMRLLVQGGAILQNINLNSYPFTSSGQNYRIRERWVTSSGKSAKLSDYPNPTLINVNDGGMVLHNKCAQRTRGCFIVFRSKDFTTCDVFGTYAVTTRLTVKPDTTEVYLALGYFREESYEHATYMFITETRDQIAEFMAGIDWSAHSEYQSITPLVNSIKRLISQREITFWPELKRAKNAFISTKPTTSRKILAQLHRQTVAYQSDIKSNDIAGVMQVLDFLKKTNLQLVHEALMELR